MPPLPADAAALMCVSHQTCVSRQGPAAPLEGRGGAACAAAVAAAVAALVGASDAGAAGTGLLAGQVPGLAGCLLNSWHHACSACWGCCARRGSCKAIKFLSHVLSHSMALEVLPCPHCLLPRPQVGCPQVAIALLAASAAVEVFRVKSIDFHFEALQVTQEGHLKLQCAQSSAMTYVPSFSLYGLLNALRGRLHHSATSSPFQAAVTMGCFR
eukprot:1157268-Pelagomonas_calceolata.AAC.4